MSISAVIAAIILPVPVFHLWLHALLPMWKKWPLLIYFAAAPVWVASFLFFRALDQGAVLMFEPTDALKNFSYVFMAIGICGIILSIATLGIKRFFVWAVLQPESTPKTRIKQGIFHFIPHPAYFGYLLIMLGNFLSTGKFYLALAFIFLLILTPLVIRFEEEELWKRTS